MITVALVVALLLVTGAFFVVAERYVQLVGHTMEDNTADHAKCLAHIAHYTGNQFAAEVLVAAAEDYASAEGQHQLKVIVQSGQHEARDGHPIPALWMENRARALRNGVQP